MGNAITDSLRSAAQGLVLADAQKHVLAYRLARTLSKRESSSISATELLKLLEQSMWDMKASVDLLEISEDAYRDNQVLG